MALASVGLVWYEVVYLMDTQVVQLGRKCFDGRRAIANLLVEYFELLSHALLFEFGLYPPEAFQPVKYCDVIVHKCVDKAVQLYIETSMRSIHRWVMYSKLRRYNVAICEGRLNLVVGGYLVEIGEALYTGAKRIDEFDELAAELRGRLQKTLCDIELNQAEAYLLDNETSWCL
ncbi:unnamed protein product [Anisakis simplex]|uniref:HORMA domain-containing protein n=1 Tax=Anisakis simplex TaxID=6269 RepID=A0A0M3KHL5_ANISI|nr:unnamed protein product [Anisakis simplex]